MQDKAWNIQTRYFILAISLLIAAVFLYYVRPLIAPLVAAVLLAYILDPPVDFLLRRFGWPRRLAVPLVYATFLIILASMPAIYAPVIYAQLDYLREEIVTFQVSLGEFLLRANLTSLVQGEDIAEFFSFLYNPQRIFGVVQAATANLAWILIIAVSTFYILLDWERLKSFILKGPPEPYRQDIQIIYEKVKEIWQAYLRGQLLLMTIIGILSWLMGSLVGLPDALLIGIIAGALDIIPSLGPLVAMVIATLVAFLQGSSFLEMSNIWFAVLVLGLFAAIQMIENIWLRPRILGQRLRLHPAVVFVAIIGSLALAGVIAALVIVPLIKTSEVLGSYLMRRILGLDPWPELQDTASTATKSRLHINQRASRARQRLQTQAAQPRSSQTVRVRGRTRSYHAK